MTRKARKNIRKLTQKVGMRQDHVKKKYRVTPSWKWKKNLVIVVTNTTIAWTMLRQCSPSTKKLSANQKNWGQGSNQKWSLSGVISWRHFRQIRERCHRLPNEQSQVFKDIQWQDIALQFKDGQTEILFYRIWRYGGPNVLVNRTVE